jgi:predicted acyl esterase
VAGSVTAFNQTCAQSKPDQGPFTASSWRRLHRKRIRFGSAAPQSFNQNGGDPSVAGAFDPISGTTNSCKTIPIENEPNDATYQHKFNHRFPMLGLPTIRAHIQTSGNFGEIAARLWDLMPNGNQRLVSRGVYALKNDQTGRIVFQLHGNGYRFGPGHTAELQLLGRDQPYYQQSNGTYTVTVSRLHISLPRLTK